MTNWWTINSLNLPTPMFLEHSTLFNAKMNAKDNLVEYSKFTSAAAAVPSYGIKSTLFCMIWISTKVAKRKKGCLLAYS